MKRLVTLTCTGLLLCASFSSGQRTRLADLPVYFVENGGVFDDTVRFHVEGRDKTLLFTREGVTIVLRRGDRHWALKLDFIGAEPDLEVVGVDRKRAVFSHFHGPRAAWKTGLATYGGVRYHGVWPGVDLVYRIDGNGLKYDFIVAPRADPSVIRLRYRGATRVGLEDGAMKVETDIGSFEDSAPLAYQTIDGVESRVDARFALDAPSADGARSFGFALGRYDCTKTLVIDPVVLVYCGYIGGSGQDDAFDVAVDDAGHAYVAGETQSPVQTFPVKTGPFTAPPGGGDAFIAKVDPSGRSLVYCGYIGGSGWDAAYGVTVDRTGRAYVVGESRSGESTFPVRGGPFVHFSGVADAFIARVNANGTALEYCGYIGSSQYDLAHDVAVDPTGAAYVVGETRKAPNFPVRIGPGLTFGGGVAEGFIAKVDPTGSRLDYCGYVGGAGNDVVWGVDVDATGHAFVAGVTSSDERSFPVRVGPFLKYAGTGNAGDAFVGKVSPSGAGFVYCGYVGGAAWDTAAGVAVDYRGRAVIAGLTRSTEQTFPVITGPGLRHAGKLDAYVARVNARGTALDYCGYIGGVEDEVVSGVALNAAGNAYVVGRTWSSEATFPVRIGPDLTINSKKPTQGLWAADAYIARVNATGSDLYFAGYIGGKGDEMTGSIAVDQDANVYVVGKTYSDETTFPVTRGPDLTYDSMGDVFVAKVSSAVVAVGQPCGGSGGMTSLPWSVGKPYFLSGVNAPPNTLGAFYLSFKPAANPVQLAPGCFAYIDPGLLIAAMPIQSDARGDWTLPGSVPTLPGLHGLELAAQAAFFPLRTPPGFATTNALVITIQGP